MDENQRIALTNELEEAKRQRDLLDAVIAYLSDRLGIHGAPTETPQQPAAAGRTDGRIPAEFVNPGQFHGMSAPRATKALLLMFGRDRPMKTGEIYEAITKGGVKIKNTEGLYHTLRRSKAFHRIDRGLWGLSEWYPEATRVQRPSENGGPVDEESLFGEETPEHASDDDGGESD